MAERIMYVKPRCPYCQDAREALSAKGLEWEERDATSRADWREELMRHSKNSGMVPTVVVGDAVEMVGWQGRG